MRRVGFAINFEAIVPCGQVVDAEDTLAEVGCLGEDAKQRFVTGDGVEDGGVGVVFFGL